MDLKAIKLELMQMLLNTDNENTLSEIKDVLKRSEKDWYDQIGEEEKKAIDEGLTDLAEDRSHSYTEVRKGIKGKYNL